MFSIVFVITVTAFRQRFYCCCFCNLEIYEESDKGVDMTTSEDIIDKVSSINENNCVVYF